MDTKLVNMCREGDYEKITNYLEDNPETDITAPDTNGITPLHIIAADERYSEGKLQCVKKLLKMGAGDALSYESGIKLLGHIRRNFNKYKTRENASALYNAPETAYYVSSEVLLLGAMKNNHFSYCFICNEKRGDNYIITPLKAVKDDSYASEMIKYEPVFFNACKGCLNEAAKTPHILKLVLAIIFAAIAAAFLALKILGYDMFAGVEIVYEIPVLAGTAAAVFFLMSVRGKNTRIKLAKRLYFDKNLKQKGYTRYSTEMGE